MGHFIIELPEGGKADVLWGILRKKQIGALFHLFGAKAQKEEERIGYIVRLENAKTDQKEYRLLKTKEGAWLTSGEGDFAVDKEDEMSSFLKKAIDAVEHLSY